MTVLTAQALAGAAFLLGGAVGGWAGWLGRGWRSRAQKAKAFLVAKGKVTGPEGQDIVDVSCLWDPHSCLNAINRCIIGTHPPVGEDHLLYLLSDQLKLLGQLGQSGGWVSPGRLQEWLGALMALHHDAPPVSEAQVHSAACSVMLPETTVQLLQMRPLGMALLPILRVVSKAHVSIEMSEVRFPSGGEQNASLVLRLRVSERQKATAPLSDVTARALREWDMQIVCECTLHPLNKRTGHH